MIDVVSTIQRIIAPAASQRVISRPASKVVVTGTAVQSIGAGLMMLTLDYYVVAPQAADEVVAATWFDPISSRRSCDHIFMDPRLRAGNVSELVAAFPAGLPSTEIDARGHLSDQYASAMTTAVEEVIARPAAQFVAVEATSGVKEIVRATSKDIIALLPEQEILPPSAS